MMMLKLRYLVLSLVMVVVGSFAMGANEPGITGWRGDGTGVYPGGVGGVTPPTKWQLVSETVAGLRFQVVPPSSDAASGTPMPDGIIRDWLIAGPISAQDDALCVEDQSQLAPKAGDKFGPTAWKAIKAQSAYVDFRQEFKLQDATAGKAAYALTYIYAPQPSSVMLYMNHSDMAQIWLNGKSQTAAWKPEGNRDMVYMPPTLQLNKGWNRLLVRSTAQVTDRPKSERLYISANLRGADRNATYASQGIKWRTQLPAAGGHRSPVTTGTGSPVVVGGKIFLQSEPADLVCVDATTGKILWVRSNNNNELASDAEKKANPEVFKEIGELETKLKTVNDSFAMGNPPKLEPVPGGNGFKAKVEAEQRLAKLMQDVNDAKYTMPKGQDVGHAGFAPITDGKYVWAWFANGVTCCYDLTGKLIWRRLDNEGSFFEHGYSSSPVFADGKIIIFMNKLIAFDAVTGNRLWTTELAGPQSRALLRFHGTPAVAKVGNASVIVLPTGHVFRVADGKMIRDKGQEISPRQQEIPSPVVIGNTAYILSTFSHGNFHKVILPNGLSDPLQTNVQTAKVDISDFPYYYNDWYMASPLIVNDLAYCMNNSGVLNVVDTKTMQMVYQKLLDIDHSQSTHDDAGRGCGISPTFAGGNIYFVGNSGTTLVIKPGRTYEQISKNKLENLIPRRGSVRFERFVATPTFAGKNMLLRGERYLYCIGE